MNQLIIRTLFKVDKKGLFKAKGIEYHSKVPIHSILSTVELKMVIELERGVVEMLRVGYSYEEVKNEISMNYDIL